MGIQAGVAGEHDVPAGAAPAWRRGPVSEKKLHTGADPVLGWSHSAEEEPDPVVAGREPSLPAE